MESERTVCAPAEGRASFGWIPRRSPAVRFEKGRTAFTYPSLYAQLTSPMPKAMPHIMPAVATV